MPGEDARRSVASLEQVWSSRLRDARSRFEAAASVSRDAIETYRQRPDATASLRNALAQEREARTEYVRVLRILTDLCSAGKFPEG